MSQDEQGEPSAYREHATTGAGGSPPDWEIDPTSGLPISHAGPEEAGGIDPTSGLPLSALGGSAATRPGEAGGQAGNAFGGPAPSTSGGGWGGTSWGASGQGTGGGEPAGHPWGASPAPSGKSPRDRGILPLLIVAVVIAALAGGLVGGAIARRSSNAPSTVVEVKNNSSYIPRMSDPQSIIAKVEPALVSIDTTAYASTGGGLFGGAFGTQVVQGAGTGMIISADGLVLTNNHVIGGASKISVTLYGQTTSDPATIVGTDPSEDLAVIKIQGVSSLPTVTFADSSKVQVGDSVLAIGNALALGGSLTVTQGIVSALDRSETAGGGNGEAAEQLTHLIQTDSAINAGNSGGPLVDAAGQVIGMNTAVASSSAGNAPAEGIGFAIASNHIQSYLPQLEKGGVVASTKAYMGVGVVDASSAASQFSIPSSVTGAFVCSVVAGSPADSAGIQAGEVITSFNGQSIASADDLTTSVQAAHAGESVTVGLWSAGSTLNAKLTLGTEPSSVGNLPIAGQQLC